jgi:hypothetical protein
MYIENSVSSYGTLDEHHHTDRNTVRPCGEIVIVHGQYCVVSRRDSTVYCRIMDHKRLCFYRPEYHQSLNLYV